ncbi:MAG: hypothetical protein AAGL89_10625 [Pseudomonadota bacterium]
MANLTIRMNVTEKQKLSAWAESRGKTVTEYIKGLVAADMEAGSPEVRAAAWLIEHEDVLTIEAERIAERGIPGTHLALNHPGPNEDL